MVVESDGHIVVLRRLLHKSFKSFPYLLVHGSTRPFSWNFNFRRKLSDSEIEDLEGLMRSLDGLHLSPSVFPSKFIWKSQVPFKVKSFVWLVAHKKHGESADHLFLHCSLTIGLWHRLFQLAKMDRVPPMSILT
ncbi:hypothetical protein CK203_084704 [Vitis vinifera]|nr:hypothetical protein CK203_084704 [Vitis vinifera]